MREKGCEKRDGAIAIDGMQPRLEERGRRDATDGLSEPSCAPTRSREVRYVERYLIFGGEVPVNLPKMAKKLMKINWSQLSYYHLNFF